jgi:hypothetical protein
VPLAGLGDQVAGARVTRRHLHLHPDGGRCCGCLLLLLLLHGTTCPTPAQLMSRLQAAVQLKHCSDMAAAAAAAVEEWARHGVCMYGVSAVERGGWLSVCVCVCVFPSTAVRVCCVRGVPHATGDFEFKRGVRQPECERAPVV